MPHVPDRHADHDHALVAAAATDDLTAAERIAVTELLSACTECVQLRSDLRALARATAALPVPARRRDYRISPEQAARLRPGGLRGMLAAFASRRFSFAAPLGTAMAALGIVGLLLAALPGPLAGGAALRSGSDATSGAAAAQVEAAPSARPTTPGQIDVPYVALAPGSVDTQASEDGDISPLTAAAEELQNARGIDELLVILAGSAILVGVALVLLRWVGRRLA